MQTSAENMCIVCFVPRQSNFSCLYKNANILSDVGVLYQDLLQTPMMVMDRNTTIPEYVCCDCEKQIKSFHCFKKKVIASYRKVLKSVNANEVDFIKIEEVTIIDANTEKETQKFQIKYLHDVDTTNSIDTKVQNDQLSINLSKNDAPHQRSSILNEDADDFFEQQQYFCHNCKLGFEESKSYEAHRMSSHSHKVTCQICYRTFDTEILFNEHLNNDHAGLPEYRCNKCEREFSNIAKFLSHITTSHKNDDTTCSLCGKQFQNKSLLMIHNKVHYDERPYACEICGKRFRSSSHRKYHRYSHMAKQFQCKLCFQMYSTPRTLNDHMKYVHRGEKPYSCDICNKSFQRKSKMNEHRKVHFK